MGSYAIAIGGTGARCLESLVHLCAVGLGPRELFILIIDPDDSNGNVERLRDVISKYNNCRDKLNLTQISSIFKTEITFSVEEEKDHLTWSPVEDEKTLREYFRYDTLISQPNESKERRLGDLVKLLYSEGELNLEWDQGFRGRSSVGAPVMARIKDSFGKKPWSELIQRIKTDLSKADARVFVFASLFGATGASGFPTVARILRDESQAPGWQNPDRFFLGGTPLLPYFLYEVEAPKEGEIFAAPQNFMVNTKAAIQHYSLVWKNSSPYDLVYLMGDQEFESTGKFAPGGKPQTNFAHYIELLAGLSAIDFYFREIRPEISKKEMLQYFAGRRREKIIYWDDFTLQTLRRNLLSFTSLAFAFRCFYLKLLRDPRFETERPLVPWYADHFKPGDLTSDRAREEQDCLAEYLKTHLEWLYEIHSCAARDIRFLNPAALSASRKRDFWELDEALFKTLLYCDINDPKCKYLSSSKCAYDRLWDDLCAIPRPAQVVESPTGRFADLLFTACQIFCIKNYTLRE
jgi:hypothetical protein